MTDDIRAISDTLLWRDVAAFVRGDWEAVVADFDEANFVGYSGRDADGLPWALAYPRLADYRDSWLEQSRDMVAAGYPDFERQLLECQRLRTIEIDGDRALVEKVFDGELVGGAATRRLSWRTYYFLRKDPAQARWLITGFAGYLDAVLSSRVTDPAASQHSTAGPYSPVLRVAPGPLVVISGQGPLDDDGRVVGHTIEEQTALTLDHCVRQLASGGARPSDVFKVNVYLADLADWDAFNAVYATRFPRPLPVRATVGVELLLGMKIEIEMWAAP